MFKHLKTRFYEGDTGASIQATPERVLEATEAAPKTVVEVGHDSAHIPVSAIHQTLEGLTRATEGLTAASNRLAELAEKTANQASDVVEEPITEAENTAENVAPDIVEPPKERYIRRNGRRVKR